MANKVEVLFLTLLLYFSPDIPLTLNDELYWAKYMIPV